MSFKEILVYFCKELTNATKMFFYFLKFFLCFEIIEKYIQQQQ